MSTRDSMRIAFITGAIVGALLFLAASAESHVTGPYATQYQTFLNESQLPHVKHIRVLSREPRVCVSPDLIVGCTWPGGPIYVSRNQDPEQLRLTFLHEQAHQLDYRELDNYARAVLRDALGFTEGLPWQGSGDELFAETYSWCAIGKYPDDTAAYSVNELLTPNTYAATCAAIREEL